MKTKHIILVLSLIVFNSCIVKSLNPFYTKDTVKHIESLIGEWKDNSNNSWTIISTKAEFSKPENNKGEISKEEKILREQFKNSYFVEYKKKKETSTFIATPFKIGNQYFLDFIPFNSENIDLSSLMKYHIIYTHSLVKLDMLNDGTVSIKWFDEKRLEKLFTEKKIKIKHKKVGAMKDDILLTATSEGLQQFLKKYMVSESAEKWQTETKFTLTKS
ncbi:hypothetical protein [Tenacibaculum jejuense]|uniref:Uncharacterized protein n=1 Tax=Tenacibaculum jejuense TaxID=584609 RepID=A0A238UFB8_9FLAO|nr:hypothetical protein [Tenacibaculum jejuense]SNR17686.1 conserved protein of unknown function [Tenacibaculum jejuense]